MDTTYYTFPYIPLHHYPRCSDLRPRPFRISCRQNIYFCLIRRVIRQKYHFLLLFSFSFFLVISFTFFDLCLLVPCPGPPEINRELKNLSATYNSSLRFICSLRSFPTPEILWTKDGIHLGSNNTLNIHQARLEDSGQYTCSANNSKGSKKLTFWIEVEGGKVVIYINE